MRFCGCCPPTFSHFEYIFKGSFGSDQVFWCKWDRRVCTRGSISTSLCTWNQSVSVYHSDPSKIYRRLTSQRYHRSLTACGSTIPKFSAILKDLKPILGFRRARSARVATVLNFDDEDLVGDFPLELVRVGGGRKLAVSEITLYSDTADVEADSSVKGNVSASSSLIATIRSLMITAGLLAAFPLLRVLLQVRRPPSSPVADVLCVCRFFGESSIRSESECWCFAQWEYRDCGLQGSSLRTRLLFAGGVGGAVGSVDSKGALSPQIQATISGRELIECCRKWERGISAMIVGRRGISAGRNGGQLTLAILVTK